MYEIHYGKHLHMKAVRNGWIGLVGTAVLAISGMGGPVVFLDEFNVADTPDLNQGLAPIGPRHAAGTLTSTYSVNTTDGGPEDPSIDTRAAIVNGTLELRSVGEIDLDNHAIVELDAPFLDAVAGSQWQLSMTVALDSEDPVFGDPPVGSWFAAILGEQLPGEGPDGARNPLAVLIRNDGRFTIWSAGVPLLNPMMETTLTGLTHRVVMTVDERGKDPTATVSIDGMTYLDDHTIPIGRGWHLSLRNYISSQGADELITMISRVDDLRIEVLSPPPAGSSPRKALPPATITVDPESALTAYASLGEWERAGDLEGWTTTNVQNPDPTVSDGLLRGGGAPSPLVPNSGDPNLMRTLPEGPDLDDPGQRMVEFRLRVPEQLPSHIDLFWSTSIAPGFSDDRVAHIPASHVPADGEFHVYRLDLGDHPDWAGRLDGLRLDPVDGSRFVNREFAVDYVRIGGDSP